MKLRAMAEITVDLTDDEWQLIKSNYAQNWAEEIASGDVEVEPSPADAWQGMLQLGEPGDFEISWDLCTSEDFPE